MPPPGPEGHDLRRIRVSTFVKFVIPLLTIVGLAVGLSGLWNYRQNKESHRQEVAARLQMVAATLAASITPAEVDALQTPGDDRQPAYGRITKMLREAGSTREIAWVGVLRQDDDHFFMVADLGETGIGYPFFYATPEHQAALKHGEVREVAYTDEFGSYLGFVSPIFNDDGRAIALVEASVQRDLFEMFARREEAKVMAALATAGAAAMLLCMLLTFWLVQRPLRRLRHGVTAVSQGDFDHLIQVRGNDDFDQLADAFNRMASDLQKLYGGLEGLVEARTQSLVASNREVQQTLDQLRSAQELLLQSEKMAAVGQLVSGVAHELNNPLAGVLGYAQLCLARAEDPKLRRSLERICEESDRAARIVRNLLTFSRKSSAEAHYIDVNDVLNQTIALREYDLRVSNVKIIRRLVPRSLYTMADSHQMQQVFLNLINNAAQAIRSKGGRGHILCRTETDANRIRVRIADDGPGIAPEDLGRIFDPFFTTKDVGQGTGLGLSICFGILQQHGGTIRAANRPEGGAEIVVELPVVLGKPEKRPAPAVLATPAKEAG